MTSPVLILFDDAIARDWMPFALTGPAGELRYGAHTLRERAEHAFGLRASGHFSADHLRGYMEPGAAPVVDLADVPEDAERIFLSSRAAVERPDEPVRADEASELIEIDGETCGWIAPAGEPNPPADFFLDPARNAPTGMRTRKLEGEVLRHVWELVSRGPERLQRDILVVAEAVAEGAATRSGKAGGATGSSGTGESASPWPYTTQAPVLVAGEPGEGAYRLGDAPLLMGPGAFVEPGVVLDLRDGPIWLDEGAYLTAFTRLAGPAYIGRGTTLLGGPFATVSIGPRCKVHGELEESVITGFSNKSHDGFLGHAYVGRWVNLGAATNNSDLKNNYGTIRIWTPNGEVDTGETKLGCLLGDHVKTAIGTLLNTGTVVGAGANLFGPAPSKHVPPFAWGADADTATYAVEKFLQTTEVMMGRRDVELSDGQRAVLTRAWELARERWA